MIRFTGGARSRAYPSHGSMCALVTSAMLIVACADTATGPMPDAAFETGGRLSNEMVDWDQRLEPQYINAHVYGSFRVGAAGGGEVIRSGAANFPGHPAAGPGTCEDGRWINPNGKPTAGTLEKPHPHCIAPAKLMEIVLEPISACYDADGSVACRTAALISKGTVYSRLVLGKFLVAGEKPVEVNIGLVGVSRSEVILGQPAAETFLDEGSPTTIVAYAIDAGTLGAGAGSRRVGTLTIDLSQFASQTENLLAKGVCQMDETLAFPCINRVVTATYQPLPAPDGVGEPDMAVEGFLWFAWSKEPYNYF